jgi:hypothetical protein
MVKNVLFGNSLGHPASSKEKTKEEGGHVVLVLLLCAGQRWGIADQQAMEGYMVCVVC